MYTVYRSKHHHRPSGTRAAATSTNGDARMNTATKLVQMADRNAKVTGSYFGVAFTGTADSSRQLFWGPDYPEQVRIVLDAPLAVYGEVRSSILIDSRQVDDGTHSIN